jgi:hypothetical protein
MLLSKTKCRGHILQFSGVARYIACSQPEIPKGKISGCEQATRDMTESSIQCHNCRVFGCSEARGGIPGGARQK